MEEGYGENTAELPRNKTNVRAILTYYIYMLGVIQSISLLKWKWYGNSQVWMYLPNLTLSRGLLCFPEERTCRWGKLNPDLSCLLVSLSSIILSIFVPAQFNFGTREKRSFTKQCTKVRRGKEQDSISPQQLLSLIFFKLFIHRMNGWWWKEHGHETWILLAMLSLAFREVKLPWTLWQGLGFYLMWKSLSLSRTSCFYNSGRSNVI